MVIILDSHIYTWLLYEPEKLGHEAVYTLEHADGIWLSVASLWELSIKYSIGKFPYRPHDLIRGMDSLGVHQIGIEPIHTALIPDIELGNKDPFDKLLIAQCIAEDATLLTFDKVLLASSYHTQDARL